MRQGNKVSRYIYTRKNAFGIKQIIIENLCVPFWKVVVAMEIKKKSDSVFFLFKKCYFEWLFQVVYVSNDSNNCFEQFWLSLLAVCE